MSAKKDGEVILAVNEQRDQLPGYRIVWQAPALRRFTVRLEPHR